MEWIIWVIVIVLIIAIVWWQLNRNSGNTAAAQDSARTDQVTSAAPPGAPGDATAPERPQAGGTAASAAAASAAAATTGMAAGTGRTTEPDVGPAAAEAPSRQGSAATAQTEPEDLEPDIESWDAATPRPSAAEPAAGASGSAETAEAPAGAADAWASPSSAPGHSPAGGDVDDWDDEDKAEWDTQWSETGGTRAAAGGAQGTGTAPAAARPGTPVHHAEYTEQHAPTLPGAESAAAEALDAEAETRQRIASSAAAEAAASHEAEPSGQAAEGTAGGPDLDQGPVPGTEPVLGGEPGQPYGEGSAAAAADGSAPDGYVVKGDASSMTYYDEDSSGYEEARAEVWFLTAAHAEAAGFRAPRRSRR